MSQSPQNNKQKYSDPNFQSGFCFSQIKIQNIIIPKYFPMTFFFPPIDSISEKKCFNLLFNSNKEIKNGAFSNQHTLQLSTHRASSLVLLQLCEWMGPFDSDTCSGRRKRHLHCPINLVILIPMLFLHALTSIYRCQQAENNLFIRKLSLAFSITWICFHTSELKSDANTSAVTGSKTLRQTT